MNTTRITATAAVVAVALTCTATASASTETERAHHADLPGVEVVNAPAKRLSLKAAARARSRARRTGRFPAPPRLVVDGRGKEHVDEHAHDTGEAPAATADTRMFGNENAYVYKRDPILGAIQRFNALNVPRHRGTYNAPRLYQVNHGSYMCGGQVWNGMYCPSINSIAWSMTWTYEAFRASGDMKWAALIAHEYGHAAQSFLGIRGGLMAKTRYSEAFADCMAGGFLYYAHANGQLDNVGRGDHYEFRDAFASLASSTDDDNVHGTFGTRYGSAVYGWNYGFDGCVAWGRSIDGV